MTRKGMSQVLSLIVAATVLMMAALTVIFMTSGSLGDFANSITSDSCTQTVKQKCQSRGTSSINIPSSCIQSNARGGEEIVTRLPNGYSAAGTGVGEPQQPIGPDAYISCP